jgi:hypothetical protein
MLAWPTREFCWLRSTDRQRRLDRREPFIPLEHRPGVRAEADFGHMHVDFHDACRVMSVLLDAWRY